MTSKFSRVSGYNPRLITWWIKGCRAPTTVTFPTRRLATSTRQNLYALREAMHKENHHAALIVDRGEIIHRPVDLNAIGIEDPHTLTIRPVNFNMNDLLDAAGIGEPDLDGPMDYEPTDGPTDDTAPPTIPNNHPIPFDYASTMKGSPTDNEDDDEETES